MKRLALLIPLLFVAIALAHEPEEGVIRAGLSLELTPEIAAAGEDTALVADIINASTGEPLTGAELRFVIDLHGPEEFMETIQPEEREPGHYWAIYQFPKPGEWEVHVEVLEPEARWTFDIPVGGAPADATGTLLLVAGAVLFVAGLAIYFLSPKKKGKRRFGLLGTVVVIVGILVILGSSLAAFFAAGAERGIVICGEDGKCFFQAHMHSFIVPIVCGEERRFDTEVGRLAATHTHEEKNVLHWHDVLPYDIEARRIIDPTPLMLGNGMDEIGVTLTAASFYEFTNGDTCPGETQPGTLKVFINIENYWETGTPWQQLEDPRSYVWTDRDIVYIAFDSRSPEEVRQFLEGERIAWPVLGVG